MNEKIQKLLVESLHKDLEHIQGIDVVVTYVAGYSCNGQAKLEPEMKLLGRLLACQSLPILLPGFMMGCLRVEPPAPKQCSSRVSAVFQIMAA